jgi:hypothetical protein
MTDYIYYVRISLGSTLHTEFEYLSETQSIFKSTVGWRQQNLYSSSINTTSAYSLNFYDEVEFISLLSLYS